MRTKGVQIFGRLTYREQLETLWRQNPTMTLNEAHRLTGCPTDVARVVRARLVAAGVVPANPRGGAASIEKEKQSK